MPVTAEGAEVRIGINRVHLEEDTGPAAARPTGGYSLVDFNRAGVPLMEIVTEPDVRSPAQARAYGETLRDILRYIGVSDGDMETGRCGSSRNISLRPMGSSGFGTRSRSRTSTASARWSAPWSSRSSARPRRSSAGERWSRRRAAGTRDGGRTISQRSKEQAHDYRYFPEPDLPPLRPSHDWVDEIRAGHAGAACRAPRALRGGAGLSAYDAGVLTADVALADYFDRVVAAGIAPKSAANWVTGEFSRLLNQHAADGLRASDVALAPEGLAELMAEVDEGRVSGTNAKAVLAIVFASGESPRTVIEREGLGQVHDAGLIEREVTAVLTSSLSRWPSTAAGSSRSTASWWGRS